MISEPEAIQSGLFAEDKTTEQKFDEWKATPGGAKIMELAYKYAAQYHARRERTGQITSIKLIWELLRDGLPALVADARRDGAVIRPVDGYSLNNIFTSLLARHIMDRRPEWQGLFELRERHPARKTRKVIVI